MPLQTGIFSELLTAERQAALVQAAKAAGAREARGSSLENPQSPLSYPAEWLLDIFNGGRTDAGTRVSAMIALQATVVLAAVDLISKAIAAFPLNTYELIEMTSGRHVRPSKSLAFSHDVFDLLRWQPNDEMSAFTFKQTLMVHALLWGNMYAEIQRDGAGRVVALWPRNPSNTKPRRINANSRLVYETSDGLDVGDTVTPSTKRQIQPEDMFHVPGLSLDGRLGQDVVWLARNAIGLALAGEKYASKFFANGATPGGVLTYPQKLTKEQEEAARRAWAEAYGGENRFRTAILQNGLVYQKIAANPQEAQMIESRHQQISEIASIFHVPLTMLGDQRGATRANAEQIGIEFVNYTLAPWTVAIEDEAKIKLLPRAKMGRNAGKTFVAKFDTRRLRLPDAASKKDFYTGLRQWSVGTVNDVRELEDMNPLDGALGESYLVPVNMVPVNEDAEPISIWPSTETEANDGKVTTTTVKPPAGPGPKTEPASAGAEPEQRARNYQEILFPIFRDAVGRAMTREKKDAATLARIFSPAVRAMASSFNPPVILSEAKNLALMARACREAEKWQNSNAESVARGVISFFDHELRKKAKGKLYLARHGQTDEDVARLTSGKSKAPLNEQGREEAWQLADFIEEELPILNAIFAPSVMRHQQTAQAVSKSTGVEVSTDDALGPWDVGDLEGTPSDGKVTQYQDSPDEIPPNGESFNAAESRVRSSVKNHMKQAMKTGSRLLVMSQRGIVWAAKELADEKADATTGSLWETDGDEWEQVF